MVTECELPPAQFLTEKPDKALARAGVYAILCDVSGKYYVGSSVNIGRRFYQHALGLRTGRHFSQKLLGSFRKYGEHSMVAKALEFCDGSQKDVLECEKKWIDVLDAVKNGLNISVEPNGNRGFVHSEKSRSNMSVGQLKSNLSNGRGRDFKFINPAGEIVHGSNVSALCKKIGLNRSFVLGLQRLAAGTINHHMGWRSINPRARKKRVDKPRSKIGNASKKSRSVISPLGDVVKFGNMAQFCRENNLSVSALRLVIRGVRPHHKQWRKT